MNRLNLDLVDVIHRTLAICPDDVEPLIRYLGMEDVSLQGAQGRSRAMAEEISAYLRKMGSNDFASFLRGEGVPYRDVVFDVGRKLGADVSRTAPADKNEEMILAKLFSDALDQMSDAEKRELFRDMGIAAAGVPWAAGGVAIAKFVLGHFGGFGVYKMSVIVANMVARALLGRGLSFAVNAALTRAVGTFLGPIGWIATGAWLLIDLAGPAFRKTTPAVVHVAVLRQMLLHRVTIGVVGDGSAGKDSLLNAVFGINTGNIDPIAGSTREAMLYQLGDSGAVHLVNYPGFNDIDANVNSHTMDYLHHTDVFLMVVDISRGLSGSETSILAKLKKLGRPIMICLNKVDVPRQEDLPKLLNAAQERFAGEDYIATAFDPDPRLSNDGPKGCTEAYAWVIDQIGKAGKETRHIPDARAA